MADTSVTLEGNLTRDPELKFLGSGQAVCNFGIAVNKRWKDQATNEQREKTSFFNVVAWRSLAEHIADSFVKGDRIMVVGTLEQRSWEAESGDKRSTVEVQATGAGASVRFKATRFVEATTREPANVGAGDGSDLGDEEPF
jgi:single-strand DNA-binding protein